MNLTDVSAIVLASGASTRFGANDKLLAPLGGKPVAQYAAECLANVALKNRFLVAPGDSVDLQKLYKELGFKIIINPSPELGQDNSLVIGICLLYTSPSPRDS